MVHTISSGATPEDEGLLLDMKADLAFWGKANRAAALAAGELSPGDRLLRGIFG